MKKIWIVFAASIFILIACEKESLHPQGKSESPSVPKVIVEKEKVEKEQPLGTETVHQLVIGKELTGVNAF